MSERVFSPEEVEEIKRQIAEAHRKCSEWEQSTFALGSAAFHCGKLESFAGPLLKEALKEGAVIIDMPSEYYAPRFVWRKT